jgi:SAM-dependent methyltransferase
MRPATNMPGDGALRLVFRPGLVTARAREAARRRLPSTIYWSIRARRFGARGVMNLAHTEAEAAEVLKRQQAILLPLLAERVSAEDQIVLDFGCGPGRFTRDLAALVGHAIGVDPVPAYLEMAPPGRDVEYRRIEGGRIPVESAAIDVVWVCLVLGSITRPRDFQRAVDEIQRVLRPGGLLFLVENTTATGEDTPNQAYRTEATYREALAFANLAIVGGYEDLGETMTVFAGRSIR